MRSPDGMAREWLRQGAEQMVSPGDVQALVYSVADLIRQRDAEWQERIGKAFDAGAEAGSERERNVKWAQRGIGGTIDTLNVRFYAARRAAVESAEGAGEEQR